MAKRKLNPLIKRTRTRSGCLTCRDRHMKCDEQQPVCVNCLRSKRKCYRGIRLNFTQYTIYNPEKSGSSVSTAPTTDSNDDYFQHGVSDFHQNQIPYQNLNLNLNQSQNPNHEIYDRELHQPRNHKILDQSITIASLYKDGYKKYEPYVRLHSKKDLQLSELHFQQDMNAYNAKLPPLASSASYPSVSTTLARSGSYLSLSSHSTRHRPAAYANAHFHPVSDFESIPPPSHPHLSSHHLDPNSRNEYPEYVATTHTQPQSQMLPVPEHTQNFGLIQTYVPNVKQQPQFIPAEYRDSVTAPDSRIHQHHQPHQHHQIFREIPQNVSQTTIPYYQPHDYHNVQKPQAYHLSPVASVAGAPPGAAAAPVPYFHAIHEGPSAGSGAGSGSGSGSGTGSGSTNYDGFYASNTDSASASASAAASNTSLRPTMAPQGSRTEQMPLGIVHPATAPYATPGFPNHEETPSHPPSETPQVHHYPGTFHQLQNQQLLIPTASHSTISSGDVQPLHLPVNPYMPPTSTVPPDLLPPQTSSQTVDTMPMAPPSYAGEPPRHSYQQAPDFSFSSGLVSTSSGGETNTHISAPESWVKLDPTYPGWEDDIKKYTQILETEKYYWLLDMFNEIGVWKSVIPPYCLKRRAEDDDGLLLECLLNCSRDNGSPRIESIIDTQLRLFDEIFVETDVKEPKKLSLNKEIDAMLLQRQIMDLLISITLILLMFQIKLTNELMQIGTYSVTIINNQLKMFGILCELVFSKNQDDFLTSPLSDDNDNDDNDDSSTFKSPTKDEYTIMKMCSIYSVTILKFFLLKCLQANQKLMDFSNIEDRNAAKWTIVYDYASSNLYYLFNLNGFEKEKLKNLYHDLVLSRTNKKIKNGISTKSDASNLRELIWKVIRYHYEVLNADTSTSQSKNTDWMDMSLLESKESDDVPRSNHVLEESNIEKITVQSLSSGQSMERATTLIDDLTQLFNPHRLNGQEDSGKLGKALLPNDRILSMGLLMTYMNSIIAASYSSGGVSRVDERQPSPSYYKNKIVGVFQALSNSFLESDSALRWERNYSWLLQT